MSENDQTQGPEQPESGDEQSVPAPRRLTRSREDRILGGVAGGLGRYFDVDPVIFRIGFVALTFLSGVGVILYLAALVFVPSEGGEGGPPPRRRALTVLGLVALALLAFALFGHFAFVSVSPFFLFPALPLLFLLAVAAAVWLVVRARGEATPQTNRELARRLLLVGLAVVAVPVLFVAAFWAAAAGGSAVIAALVIASGVLLVLGAFRGGLRWLILPALVLAVPTGIVAAADIELRGGYGDREYAPTSLTQLPAGYELAAGHLQIDLRGIDFPKAGRRLGVDLGLGEAVLVVPEDVCVVTDAHVGAGYLRVLGRDAAGFDVDSHDVGSFVFAMGRVPLLFVDANLGMGALQVVHDPREAEDRFERGRFGRRDFDFDEETAARPQEACAPKA